MRVIAIDPGMNLGWALLGGKEPLSGSVRMAGSPAKMGQVMRHADRTIRELIAVHRPDVIALATIFIGSRGGRPVDPHSISAVMGVKFKAEEIADELRIRAVEISEPECRRAFLTAVPKKSKAIKAAVMRACRLRGWPAGSEHAADAYCVAARAMEILDPVAAHEMTPLFQNRRKPRK